MLIRSPRALKRYLNTYRLLKATVDPEDLARARMLPAPARGRDRAGRALLAASVAAPPEASLAALLPPEQGVTEAERAARRAVRQRLADRVGPAFDTASCQPAQGVAHEVQRFMFRLGAG